MPGTSSGPPPVPARDPRHCAPSWCTQRAGLRLCVAREAGPESDLDLLVSTTPGTSSWFPAGLILELEELLGREGRRDHRGGAGLVLARAGARGSHSPVRDQRLYLIQMLERVERIESYTGGGRTEFLRDHKTQDAVVRSFEVVRGEAAKRVSDEVRALSPEIPWRKSCRVSRRPDPIKYEGIDLEEVWKRIEEDLPPRRLALAQLMQRPELESLRTIGSMRFGRPDGWPLRTAFSGASPMTYRPHLHVTRRYDHRHAVAGEPGSRVPGIDRGAVARVAAHGRAPDRPGEVLVEAGDTACRSSWSPRAGSRSSGPPAADRDADRRARPGPVHRRGQHALRAAARWCACARRRAGRGDRARPRASCWRSCRPTPSSSEILMRAFILRRVELIAHGLGDVVLVGSSHCAGTLRVEEFLTRNGHPYAYIDLDRDAGVQELLDRFHVGRADVPVADLPRRAVLRNPTNQQIADCLGFNDAIEPTQVRDLVIVGAGPVGAGGGGVRRLGRARRPGARVERAGRTGRLELEDRELPRVSRPASRARSSPAGPTPRRRSSARRW